MVAPRQHPTLTLLDELLAEQGRLQTPVARYSAAHDSGRPALEPVYRDLIPLTAPAPGEQYAFEVDLDACSGCKACVAGCHSLNGLDETETWRDVGLVLGGGAAHPFQQTVTTACHHCADPGCLNGCPVLAYEKDPVTGIVRHLDDQCIGCSYCVLKCPYEVPKYSERLGIVRKCDLCHGRLAHGEAPACVQACPTHAIRVVTVKIDTTGPRPRADTSRFLPSAPDPARTQPTTRYVSRRPLPADLRAADAGTPRLQPGHSPLAVMLVLTQVAVGLQLAALGARPAAEAWLTQPWAVALGLGVAGLTASVFHLGRPLRAWRIFLGLRRSWLSREALVFGAWLVLALGAAFPAVPVPLGGLATVMGLCGVFCSAMIYVDTGRAAWRAQATFTLFGGTTLLGLAAGQASLWLAAAALVKLGLETRLWRKAPDATRALLRGPLRRTVSLRRVLAALGTALVALEPIVPDSAICGFGFILGGELAERSLYFRAVDASKMPGLAA